MATIRYRATDLITGKVLADAIPLEVESFSQQLNGGGTLTGSLDLSAVSSNVPFIEALECTRAHLWVLYNGYPVWDGIVWDWPDQSREQGQLPISAATIDSILGKRLITATLAYTAVDLFAVFRDLVNYATTKNSNYITAGSRYQGPASPLVAQQAAIAGLRTGPNTKAGVTWTADYLWSDMQSVADALGALVQSGNLEYYFLPGIDTSGNLITTLILGYTAVGRAYPQARYSVTFPGSAIDYAYQRTGSQAANYVWATAEPNGSSQQWISQYPHGVDQANLTAGYPLLETTVSWQFTTITAQSQVDSFAAGEVTLLSQQMTTPVIKVAEGSPPNIRDLVLGDTFPFAATSNLHPAGDDGTPGYQELVRLTGWEYFPAGPQQTPYLALTVSAVTATE